MAILNQSASSVLFVTHAPQPANKKTVPIYGSVVDADNYFFAGINFESWSLFSQEQKWRAIAQATRKIDRLNYVGRKADCDQPLEFPRAGSDDVPVDIEQATYEVALKLLEGVDTDMEANNLSVRSQSFAGVRTEYNRDYVPAYITAGIPCHTAWGLLFPYLRDTQTLRLSRRS